jgi:alanyl-tRNA synthetase
MTAKEIIQQYLTFFEQRGHTIIPNAPLVPENDPTTLFTSSGMQPLVPYLLGEPHPAGTRLVNAQNCFRAVDIEEVGDNRHTTFFRMLGNWSLGDYFKKEQLPWIWEFLTKELGFDPKRLYVTVFEGSNGVPTDDEAVALWKDILTKEGLNPKERIFYYTSNWWSRSGTPDKMPTGEPGGPDSEIFYDYGADLKIHENSKFSSGECHVNCDCGRYLEICNSVFMQYKKQSDGILTPLPKPNIDFGGGFERIYAALENKQDIFQTSLFAPIIKVIETQTGTSYEENKQNMRIVADHLIAAMFIVLAGIKPANKEQGYILRRLLRRSIDHLYTLKEVAISPILETIAKQYYETDPEIGEQFEMIKFTIIEEERKYANTRSEAKKYIEKKYHHVIPTEVEGSNSRETDSSTTLGMTKNGDELLGTTEITSDDAFYLYTSQGLSPTQIKSLGYSFDEHEFAEKMNAHKSLSKTASAGKFKGGLADHSELTIKGHTATHLLQQALRDVLGDTVHQTGSNITVERLRFDFNYGKKLTDEQIAKVQEIVMGKIKEDLPVHFEMMPIKEAKKTGAIGLFGDKYQDTVKVYFIGDYSKELCGGPHVEHTGVIKSFTITKQEKLGQGQMRLYAVIQ